MHNFLEKNVLPPKLTELLRLRGPRNVSESMSVCVEIKFQSPNPLHCPKKWIGATGLCVCVLKIFDLVSACALLGLVRQKHIDCYDDECTVTAEFG